MDGRSHRSKHHHVAGRFFGRTKSKRTKIFKTCPWELEEVKPETLCYDCHEELLHNPVLTQNDIRDFAMLVKYHRCNEVKKTDAKIKIAGRIKLFHAIIRFGIDEAKRRKKAGDTSLAAEENP